LPATRQTNEATGEWPIGDTPLAVNLTPQGRADQIACKEGRFAEGQACVRQPDRMKADVEWLAAPEREGRGAGKPRS